jgi:hypothetical protein
MYLAEGDSSLALGITRQVEGNKGRNGDLPEQISISSNLDQK